MTSDTVSLKEFVKESLLELVLGVAAAQSELPEGAQINPTGMRSSSSNTGGLVLSPRGEAGTLVEFDVAVTATKKEGTEGGVGVFFAPMSLGARGKRDAEEMVTSRMKFTVPVFYSQGK